MESRRKKIIILFTDRSGLGGSLGQYDFLIL
ncbi:hypothetical protein EV214_103217 [Marinisporobacter balticus]|uniref:Uncharacterized protein n=1 Tax=Marinisporobacter balticus TaxID=2018667 RepID=A0A4R2KYL0_9FIRM|nr:hypothetical protein EV214_103217 [Marinisporobacter balticus]